MSYKQRLSHLDREGSRSVTAQIVDAFAAAIESGDPGSNLLPARELGAITAEIFESEGSRTLQYDTALGVAELRQQLALLGERRGVADEPDQIVVTGGARQGLTLVTRAVLRPGDVVACESPTFFGAIEAIRATGAEALAVPTDEDGLDTDALEALLRRHEVRLVFLQPHLHNPTGRDLSEQRAEHLLALARRHGFFVFEDGVYADLRIEGTPSKRLRGRAPEHVIYVDSFSKTVGGGLRLGWVAASGPVLDRIAREKRRDDIHCVALTQLVVARFLARGGDQSHPQRAAPFFAEPRGALLGAG